MKDDYLWDGSGEPDPEVKRLEGLLGRLRSSAPAPPLPAAAPAPSVRGSLHPSWRRALSPRLVTAAVLAAAAVLAVIIAGGTWVALRTRTPVWEVARLEGAPRVGSRSISATGDLAVGQWLETDGASRARINVGSIGQVLVEPNTRLRLVEAQWTNHRLALARGTLHASIWAPPRLFFVETSSAVAVDLGCQYTLQVDDSGDGLLSVTTGWVSFEKDGRESYVPAGASCRTKPGSGPGTPYFENASAALRSSLQRLDFEQIDDRTREKAMDTILTEARRRDALTLWHLLGRAHGEERARVFDRMSQLVPPPEGVTREGILEGDNRMLDLWWDELGLGHSLWRKAWKKVTG